MAAEIIPLVSNKLLLRLDDARRALAEAKDLYEVKAIRDFAQSAADLLKQQRLSQDAVFDALELKLKAERKLGKVLQQTVNHLGSRGVGSTMLPTVPEGISKIQSSRWQRSASVSKEIFCGYLEKCRQSYTEPTTNGVLRLVCNQMDATRNGNLFGVTELVSSFDVLVASGRKFSTVYADPPWQYDNQGTRARTDRHYPTLTVDEIINLPVKSVVADDAHLHLWVTNSFLFEARDVMQAWGFEYKSVFVWCKPHYGIGNYWRVAHEFLLLGTRGKCPFRDRSQRSWLEFPRTKHSSKPEEIRLLMEKVSPPDYLELFGRSKVSGWTVLGNEV